MKQRCHSHHHRPFRSAKEEVKSLLKPEVKSHSSAYQLAFRDEQFMLRQELRSVRLQLELLKPELSLKDEHIESTAVIFGSARIIEPAVAKKQVERLEQALQNQPSDPHLKQQLMISRNLLAKSHYYDEARKLAKLISATCQNTETCNLVVITGGGPGIMEAANRGADDIQAKSIGLNIVLPLEQGPNPYISPELCFQFHYFAIRKMHFLIRARALIFFPGGYGTLDELFEVLTLMQTRKIEWVPLILIGKAFWEKILNFNALVEEGTIAPEDIELFRYAETAEEAWRIIQAFYPKETGKPNSSTSKSAIDS